MFQLFILYVLAEFFMCVLCSFNFFPFAVVAE